MTEEFKTALTELFKSHNVHAGIVLWCDPANDHIMEHYINTSPAQAAQVLAVTFRDLVLTLIEAN